MTIKDFLKTENGARYADALKGCDKRLQVEYYEDLLEYIKILEDNNWTPEDIIEQLRLVGSEWYKIAPTDNDFVIVIN